MHIVIDKREIMRFRTLCRQKWPIEVLVGLWGHREVDRVVVEKLVTIPHRGTQAEAKYNVDQIAKSKMAALKAGLEWLGTIHSHCSTPKVAVCHHLSDDDISTALENGETLSGVVYVYAGGKRSEMHWHQAKPLPTVEYR